MSCSSLRPKFSVAFSLLPLLAATLVGAAGCDVPPDESPQPAPAPPTMEIPAVNVPRALREWNWGGGSCVHASTVMHLRWQNAMELADYWRKTYSGGESYNGLTSKLTRNKVPYYATAGGGGQDVAESHTDFIGFLEANGYSWFGTTRGDVDVLERCTAERRGGVIFYYPNHSILFCGFVHFDGDADPSNGLSHPVDYAIVLDNNRIDKFIVIEKGEFVRNWRAYGGVCVVPTIGWPRPPIPFVAQQ